jgi:hypothetical protein
VKKRFPSVKKVYFRNISLGLVNYFYVKAIIHVTSLPGAEFAIGAKGTRQVAAVRGFYPEFYRKVAAYFFSPAV